MPIDAALAAQKGVVAHTAGEAAQTERPSWKILVVDDEPAVHQVTKLALRNLEVLGRPLVLINALSAKGAQEVLLKHDDIAVILLDVVMENDQAGLELVRHIRDELSNHAVRIVLRTGQPGQAPERRVMIDYDINDYKEKTELTANKLFTTVTVSVRTYRDILALETRRQTTLALEAELHVAQQKQRKLAHELQTPLGVGIMAASMQMQQIDQLASAVSEAHASDIVSAQEGLRETATLMHSSLERCVAILAAHAPSAPLSKNQASELNQDANVLPLRSVPLANCLADAAKFTLIGIPGHRIVCTVNVPDDLQVITDATAWQQIITNLVNNSARHGFRESTEASASGHITITAERVGPDRLHIRYSDNGCGIHPSMQSRIFEDGASTRLGEGGQGLGMGIVQALVQQRLLGTITVLEAETGAAFLIDVPI